MTTAHADRIRADLVVVGAGGSGWTAASIVLESGARKEVTARADGSTETTI